MTMSFMPTEEVGSDLEQLLAQVLSTVAASPVADRVCVVVGAAEATSVAPGTALVQQVEAGRVLVTPRAAVDLAVTDTLHGVTMLDPRCDTGELRNGRGYSKTDVGNHLHA